MSARFPFVVVLAFVGLIFAWGATSRAIGVDFLQFWSVARALDRPDMNVYSEDGRNRLGAEFLEKARETGDAHLIEIAEYRAKFETYSSPFLYSSFRYITTGDYHIDLRNYRILLLACLVLSVIAIARLLQLTWDVALAALAIFLGWFAPVTSDLRVGNVNCLQLGALALYLWVALRTRWRYREILGGVILGLGVAFKPNFVFIPMTLALASIFSRQFGKLVQLGAGLALGAVAALTLSGISFGSLHCWIDWVNALRSMPDEIISIQYGNYAPARIASEWIGMSGIPVTILVLAIWVVALWLNRGRDSTTNAVTGKSSPWIACTLGCLLVVLAPGLAWLHYHVLVIPVFLVLARSLTIERHQIAAGIFMTIALACYCFEAVVYVSPPFPQFAQSILILVGSLILLGLIISELLVSRSRTAH